MMWGDLAVQASIALLTLYTSDSPPTVFYAGLVEASRPLIARHVTRAMVDNARYCRDMAATVAFDQALVYTVFAVAGQTSAFVRRTIFSPADTGGTPERPISTLSGVESSHCAPNTADTGDNLQLPSTVNGNSTSCCPTSVPLDWPNISWDTAAVRSHVEIPLGVSDSAFVGQHTPCSPVLDPACGIAKVDKFLGMTNEDIAFLTPPAPTYGGGYNPWQMARIYVPPGACEMRVCYASDDDDDEPFQVVEWIAGDGSADAEGLTGIVAVEDKKEPEPPEPLADLVYVVVFCVTSAWVSRLALKAGCDSVRRWCFNEATFAADDVRGSIPVVAKRSTEVQTETGGNGGGCGCNGGVVMMTRGELRSLITEAVKSGISSYMGESTRESAQSELLADDPAQPMTEVRATPALSLPGDALSFQLLGNNDASGPVLPPDAAQSLAPTAAMAAATATAVVSSAPTGSPMPEAVGASAGSVTPTAIATTADVPGYLEQLLVPLDSHLDELTLGKGAVKDVAAEGDKTPLAAMVGDGHSACGGVRVATVAPSEEAQAPVFGEEKPGSGEEEVCVGGVDASGVGAMSLADSAADFGGSEEGKEALEAETVARSPALDEVMAGEKLEEEGTRVNKKKPRRSRTRAQINAARRRRENNAEAAAASAGCEEVSTTEGPSDGASPETAAPINPTA